MKKLFAIALSAILATSSLVACSDDGGQTASPAGTVSGEDNTSGSYSGPMTLEEVPKPTKDPFGKYETPVKVSMVHSANDGAFWFPEGDSIDNNVYTRRYKETLGIEYNFKWTCPGSQATEKMNTMFTGGDYPDVMSVTREQFEKLYAAGQLEDLTIPLIEYASEYTRKYLTGEYKGLLDVATKDGKYYGITNGFSYKDGGDMIWIRKDWLDKLKLPTPKTVSELEAVMEAFKTQDPDGNGKDDTYAIAMSTSAQQPWEWGLGNAFFNIYGSYAGSNPWYQNSEGTIEHGLFGKESRVGTRKALETANEYYKKGYIDKDFATMDLDMRNADMFNGKSGIFYYDVWGAYWPLILHKDVDPKADWIPIPIVSNGDKTTSIMRNDVQVANILVVKKGFKNPEALVKMTNLYHDLNNNPETMEFEEYNTNPTDSNQIFLAYPLSMFNPAFNYEGFEQITAAQKSGNTDGLCSAYKMFYQQAMEYEKNGDKGGWSPYRSYLKDDSSLGVIDNYVKNKRIVFNEYTSEPTPFMIENEPVVKKMYDEMAVKVISGAVDISEFDKFIANWESIYGNTATKEVNDWFAAKGSESIQDQMTK